MDRLLLDENDLHLLQLASRNQLRLLFEGIYDYDQMPDANILFHKYLQLIYDFHTSCDCLSPGEDRWLVCEPIDRIINLY